MATVKVIDNDILISVEKVTYENVECIKVNFQKSNSKLLAWGTDLIRVDDQWNNDLASKYREINRVTDPLTLRINAYRVLLTRGRDGCVVFVPTISPLMQKTYKHLKDCGFKVLDTN